MQAQRPLQGEATSRIRWLDQAQPCLRASGRALGGPFLPRATAQPEAATKEGWDPEGLLQQPPARSKGSLLADHAARRRARQAQTAELPTAESLTQQPKPDAATHDVPLSLSRSEPAGGSSAQAPPAVTAGRKLAAEPALLAELTSVLEQQFWPVDLTQHPAAELLHLDPPILRLPSFLAAQACQSIMQFATAGGEAASLAMHIPCAWGMRLMLDCCVGLMQPSRVGGDNVSGPASQQNVPR